jgi:dihydrofolate reductase
MRKLKLQMQMTLDGFVAGPNGEMDWMTFNWSNDLIDSVEQLTAPVDTILLGRNLAQGFIPHWTASLNSPEPDLGAEKMVQTPKVVFSKTLETSVWDNTVLAKGNLADEIDALKRQDKGDIIVYGGGSFVSALIRTGLIDEYNLFVNPVAIGSGMAIFNGLDSKQNLTLKVARQFDCGITLLRYETTR